MTRLIFAGIVVLCVLAIISIAYADDGVEPYPHFAQINPFERDRRPPPPPPPPQPETPPTSRPAPAPPPPEATRWVLRGIAFGNGEPRAFVEHLTSGESRSLSAGEPFAGGDVVGLAIDAVRFTLDGETRWVLVGTDFSGGAVATAVAGPSAREAAREPEREMSIVERLRLRRQQERNR
jgi:hypothetical protein